LRFVRNIGQPSFAVTVIASEVGSVLRLYEPPVAASGLVWYSTTADPSQSEIIDRLRDLGTRIDGHRVGPDPSRGTHETSHMRNNASRRQSA
jgi:hypothetical protein